MNDQNALNALFLPFHNGWCPAPAAGQRVLFLNAQDLPGRESPLSAAHITRQQGFKPWALPWLAGGAGPIAATVDDIHDTGFDMVLVLAGRQKDARRAQLAQALRRVRPGGCVLAAAANDAGGKRLQKEMTDLGLSVRDESKYHSRVVWCDHVDGYNAAAAESLLAAAAPQRRLIGDLDLWTRPGLFSWDRLDHGSAFLLQHLPHNFSGRGADLGAGLGVLAHYMLQHNPDIAHIAALEAEADAVALAQRNLADYGDRVTVRWHAVGAEDTAESGLDFVVMNPPFHEGAKAITAIGRAFIRSAHKMLRPGGMCWMVANAHLPYEAEINSVFSKVTKAAEGAGFKIYCARK